MRNETAGKGAGQEWRANWPLALAAFFGLGLNSTHGYSFGVFITPLSHEFGWGRSEISSALVIISCISLCSAYFVGLLIDRVGPRRVAIPGVIAYCASFAILSLVGSSLWQWWALWLLIAVSVQFIKPTVWAAAIAGRFSAGRGLALAVMMSGSGLCSAVSPLLASYFIEQSGWRAAYLALAIFWVLLTLPVCIAFFYGAKDLARCAKAQPDAPLSASLSGIGVKEAFRSASFWKIVVPVVASTGVTLGLMVHFVPLLTDAGMNKTTAAMIAGLIGVASVPGRLCTGFLLDRTKGPIVGVIILLLPVICNLVLLTVHPSIVPAIVAACLLGFVLGAEADIGAYLMARYFGMRHFGALYGALIALLGIAYSGGPMLAALIFDSTGSYVGFLQIGIPISIGAAVLLCMLKAYPSFERVEQAPAQ